MGMDADRSAWILGPASTLGPSDFKVWVFLVAACEWDPRYIRVSFADVAAHVGLSWSTVARAFAGLSAAGLVEKLTNTNRESLWRLHAPASVNVADLRSRYVTGAMAGVLWQGCHTSPPSPPSLSPPTPPPLTPPASPPPPRTHTHAGTHAHTHVLAAAAEVKRTPRKNPRVDAATDGRCPNAVSKDAHTTADRPPAARGPSGPNSRSDGDRSTFAQTMPGVGVHSGPQNNSYVNPGVSSDSVGPTPNTDGVVWGSGQARADVVKPLVRSAKVRLELVETYPLSVLKEAARIAAGRKTAKDIGAVFVSILRDGEATEAAAKRATADAAARVADVSRVADVAARAADADAAKVNADRETAVILKADAAAVRAALVTVGAALPHVTSIIRAGTDPAADSAAVIRAARSPLVRGDVAALLSRS